MKKLLFLLTSIVLLNACKKDSKPSDTDSVTINGQQYATVKIGTQTWTAVNYNGTGGVNYDNSNTNDATYGKLYTLAEAKAVSLPAGWRLATQADYNTLMTHLGGTQDAGGYPMGSESVARKLMSTSGWSNNQNGNNSSGFNVYPAGIFGSNVFEHKGIAAGLIMDIAPGVNGFLFINSTAVGTGAVPSNARGSIRFVKAN